MMQNNVTQQFHLGDILSITTDYLLSPTHMFGYRKILDFMSDDNLSDIQFPRVSNECKPYLIEQFPFLAEIDKSELKSRIEQSANIKFDGNADEVRARFVLAPFIEKYGEWHDVRPMRSEDHEVMSATEELDRMGLDIEVIEIDITEDDSPSPYGNINF